MRARLAVVHPKCAEAGYGESRTRDCVEYNADIKNLCRLLDLDEPSDTEPEDLRSMSQKREDLRIAVSNSGWHSSRIDLVIKIIKTHFKKFEGKIAVFSEYLCTLDVLEVALVKTFSSKYQYLRYDATVNQRQRTVTIEAFFNDGSAQIILVKIRSGGVGVSFVPAGRIIHLDQS
jgi:SNF2 family DNA or RNA helicase